MPGQQSSTINAEARSFPFLKVHDGHSGSLEPDQQAAWLSTQGENSTMMTRRCLAFALPLLFLGSAYHTADAQKPLENGRDEKAAPGPIAPGDTPPPAAEGPRNDDGTNAPQAPQDQVINDDLIVVGSECVGLDCADGESFGFDTIRLKENNLRIRFMDTSTAAGFATNDWQLTANGSGDGGKNFFSVDDIDGGRTPFLLEAGARTNALYIRNNGSVGFGTGAPVVDLHTRSGDTPTLRLEQDGSAGWTPQTWDVGGNEVGFFVRDITNGSRLSLRIRPGAPGSSIDVAADGDVGIGSDSPQARLHVKGDPASGEPAVLVSKTDNTELLKLDANGNLSLAGLVSVSSSREVKENFRPVDGDEILDKVSQLSLGTWNYKTEGPSVTHMGPIAEEFTGAFRLGADEKKIGVMDVSGVALTAIQALDRKNREKDARIAELEARIAAQEAQLSGDREQLVQLARELASIKALISRD